MSVYSEHGADFHLAEWIQRSKSRKELVVIRDEVCEFVQAHVSFPGNVEPLEEVLYLSDCREAFHVSNVIEGLYTSVIQGRLWIFLRCISVAQFFALLHRGLFVRIFQVLVDPEPLLHESDEGKELHGSDAATPIDLRQRTKCQRSVRDQ